MIAASIILLPIQQGSWTWGYDMATGPSNVNNNIEKFHATVSDLYQRVTTLTIIERITTAHSPHSAVTNKLGYKSTQNPFNGQYKHYPDHNFYQGANPICGNLYLQSLAKLNQQLGAFQIASITLYSYPLQHGMRNISITEPKHLPGTSHSYRLFSSRVQLNLARTMKPSNQNSFTLHLHLLGRVHLSP